MVLCLLNKNKPFQSVSNNMCYVTPIVRRPSAVRMTTVKHIVRRPSYALLTAAERRACRNKGTGNTPRSKHNAMLNSHGLAWHCRAIRHKGGYSTVSPELSNNLFAVRNNNTFIPLTHTLACKVVALLCPGCICGNAVNA